jgi:hypothetical protein
VAVEIAGVPARLVNVSYGGFCVEIEQAPSVLPKSFEVTASLPALGVHAEAVWLRRGPNEHWLCGARVSNTSDGWRGWVDAIA